MVAEDFVLQTREMTAKSHNMSRAVLHQGSNEVKDNEKNGSNHEKFSDAVLTARSLKGT